MTSLGWPELLLIALVIVLLFGTRRLPSAARSLGQALREFKAAAGTDEGASAGSRLATSEQPLLVFISSRIGEFAEERQEIAKAIARIPLTRPWIFEQTPASSDPLAESYLQKVAQCDIFIQVLGEEITEPVAAEYRAAHEAGKPRLVFTRDGGVQRSEALDAYLKQIDTKWTAFHDTNDLCERVQAALVDELIKGYRRYRLSAEQVAALVAFNENLDGIVSIKQKLLDLDRSLRGNPADVEARQAREAAERGLRERRQRLADGSISPERASRRLWSAGGSQLRISPRGFSSERDVYSHRPEFNYLQEGITVENPTRQVANVTVSLMDTKNNTVASLSAAIAPGETRKFLFNPATIPQGINVYAQISSDI